MCQLQKRTCSHDRECDHWHSPHCKFFKKDKCQMAKDCPLIHVQKKRKKRQRNSGAHDELERIAQRRVVHRQPQDVQSSLAKKHLLSPGNDMDEHVLENESTLMKNALTPYQQRLCAGKGAEKPPKMDHRE